MKATKMILGILTMVSFFISCTTDDEIVSEPENVTITDLEGIWNVTVISGGIGGINESYNSGDIIWRFESDNARLTIEIEEGLNVPLNPGTFMFSVLENEGRSFLVIDTMEQGLLSISGNTLELDQSRTSTANISDAFLIRFER